MMIKKYNIIPSRDLRKLCINYNWFTAGDCEQYEKLFYANEHDGYSFKEIATIIWLCSDDNWSRNDIFGVLKAEQKRFEIKKEAEAYNDTVLYL